jgi:hypothetical protein
MSEPELTTEERALIFERSVAVGAELVAERQRQILEEGYTPKHDEASTFGELALAAAAYAALAGGVALNFVLYHLWPRFHWRLKPKSPRRDLVRAGALVIAAIERLDRDALARADTEAS